MSASAKTPLQAVVSTLCEVLTKLSPDDQACALETVRLTLGLGTPYTQFVQNPASAQEEGWALVLAAPPDLAQPPLAEPALFQDPTPRRELPTVVVQMMGDRPVVMGRPADRSGRRLVVVGPQHDQRRIFPAPRVQASADAASSAQVPSPSRRGGYVRSIR